jgi:Secretion system C-terminal sorting domain
MKKIFLLSVLWALFFSNKLIAQTINSFFATLEVQCPNYTPSYLSFNVTGGTSPYTYSIANGSGGVLISGISATGMEYIYAISGVSINTPLTLTITDAASSVVSTTTTPVFAGGGSAGFSPGNAVILNNDCNNFQIQTNLVPGFFPSLTGGLMALPTNPLPTSIVGNILTYSPMPDNFNFTIAVSGGGGGPFSLACSYNVSVNNPMSLTNTLLQTNPTVYGINNGQITVPASYSGVTNNYTYSYTATSSLTGATIITPTLNGSNYEFKNLYAGTYTVTQTSSPSSCVYTQVINIVDPPNLVTGFARIDIGAGCGASAPGAKVSVNATNGIASVTAFSGSNGQYLTGIPAYTYTLVPTALINPSYYTISPSISSISFPPAVSPGTQDFCLTPVGVHHNLDIAIHPYGRNSSGFNTYYTIAVTNTGNQVDNGCFTFTYNNTQQTYVSASFTPSSTTTNSISYCTTNINPMETKYYSIVLNNAIPPIVNEGDYINTSASITMNTNTDEDLSNNAKTSSRIVRNSYDPNNKICTQGDTIFPSQVANNLNYTINFENTGTASAVNITVKDFIDLSQYDISTLVPGVGSVPFTTTVVPPNEVNFTFTGINLPATPGSNTGYLTYSIKPKSTLVKGDSVKNRAEIYFDFNSAVITDYAVTYIDSNGCSGNIIVIDDGNAFDNTFCLGTQVQLNTIINGVSNPSGYSYLWQTNNPLAPNSNIHGSSLPNPIVNTNTLLPYFWSSNTFYDNGNVDGGNGSGSGCCTENYHNLIITNSNTGCTDTIPFTMVAIIKTSNTRILKSCDSVTFRGITYTSNVAHDSSFYTNQYGCDSIEVVVVHLAASYKDTVYIAACDSFSWFDNTYSVSGVYFKNFTTSPVYYGGFNYLICDSSKVLILTVTPSVTASTTLNKSPAAYCPGEQVYVNSTVNGVLNPTAGYTYTWFDATYGTWYANGITTPNYAYLAGTNTGTYSLAIQTEYGTCKDTTQFTITILPSARDTITITSSTPYTWTNGIAYSTPGYYTQTFTNTSGCDSVKILNLQAPPPCNNTFIQSLPGLADPASIGTSTSSEVNIFPHPDGQHFYVTGLKNDSTTISYFDVSGTHIWTDIFKYDSVTTQIRDMYVDQPSGDLIGVANWSSFGSAFRYSTSTHSLLWANRFNQTPLGLTSGSNFNFYTQIHSLNNTDAVVTSNKTGNTHAFVINKSTGAITGYQKSGLGGDYFSLLDNNILYGTCRRYLNTSGDFRVGVFAHDANTGNELWSKTIVSVGNTVSGHPTTRMYPEAPIKDADSLVIVSSGDYLGNNSYLTGATDLIVAKTDDIASVGWTRNYYTSSYDRPRAKAIKNTSGGYYLVGNYYDGTLAQFTRGFVVKTDKQGHTIWAKQLGIGNTRNEINNAMEMNGSLFVTMSSNSYSATNDLLVIKLDLDGNAASTCTLVNPLLMEDSLLPNIQNNLPYTTANNASVFKNLSTTPVNLNIATTTLCASCCPLTANIIHTNANQTYCVGDSLRLNVNINGVVNPTGGFTYQWFLGNPGGLPFGNQPNLVLPIASTGVGFQFSVVISSVNGICKDTLYTTLSTINPPTPDTAIVSACYKYVWPVNGLKYTSTGFYSQSYVSANGCDSIKVLNLTINQASIDTITVNTCSAYTWYNVTYSTSGFYQNTFSNAAGCDSTIVLDLTIAPSGAIVCDTTAINISTGVNNAGLALAVGTTDPNWSDITTPLPMKVSPTYAPYWEPTPVAITNARWLSHTGTSGGLGNLFSTTPFTMERLFSITSPIGQLLPAISITANDAALGAELEDPLGNIYPLTFTTPLAYHLGANATLASPLPTTVGVWKLRVNVLFADQTNSFLVSGNILQINCDTAACCPTTLTATQTDTTSLYCLGDSVTVNVQVNGLSNPAGYTYQWYQSTILDATFVPYAAAVGGNTSTLQLKPTVQELVFLHVVVTQPNGVCKDTLNNLYYYASEKAFDTINKTACNSFVWNNVTYTSSGTYTQFTPSPLGCDSTHILNLIINLGYRDTTYVLQCDSFKWTNGVTYYTGGFYTQSFLLNNGCDSVLVLALNMDANACNNLVCATCPVEDSINLSTGIDNAGTVITTQINDPHWLLTSQPSSSMVSIPKIIPSPIWAMFDPTKARYINEDGNPGKLHLIGDYVYERKFQICIAGNFILNYRVNADNHADVYVDGVLIGSTLGIFSGLDYGHLLGNAAIAVNYPIALSNGVHHLRIVVNNDGINTGLWANASIKPAALNGGALIADTCTLFQGPLSLQKLNLTAALQNQTAVLQWNTTNEVDMATLQLQKSEDGITYTSINEQAAKNKEANAYNFADQLLPNECVNKLYYKVRATYKNGLQTKSNIASVQCKPDNTVTIYPNPIKGLINIATSKRYTEVTMYNMSGAMVKKWPYHASHAYAVDDFPKGVYFIKIVTNSIVFTQKIIVE